MTGTTLGILIVIIAYILMMVGIGIWFSKKNNDVNDFYLGGRKLGPLVTAMSAEASDMSSWLLMGLPGLAYLTGIADAGCYGCPVLFVFITLIYLFTLLCMKT